MESRRPNVLFLMADQMQGRVLRPDSPCRTPNLDRLAARGVRFDRAYTPNAICSPARASLMTGLMPHNHGVLTVTHCVDRDQSVLRNVPHWAQSLDRAGYCTGYFGKWHVERSNHLARFGWRTHADKGSDRYRFYERRAFGNTERPEPNSSLRHVLENPPGYKDTLLYGVTDEPPQRRGVGLTCGVAGEYLDEVLAGDEPWCCFVSVTEPHDPFVAGEEAFAQYDVDAIELPSNAADPMDDKPGLYRKSARAYAYLSDRQKREATACYWASVTEIDEQFGRLIEKVEQAGQLEDTIVVVTSDHGELLGAHGLYCKNAGAFEEVYNIPMLISGPGVARGATSGARVGLHDLAPTLLELVGLDTTIGGNDSRSFAPTARDPGSASNDFTAGYAEFEGTRYRYTQRIAWDGGWKFVHNGFDFDELYDLSRDPYEQTNLADRPEHRERLEQMLRLVWQRASETGDHTLVNTDYPACRLAAVGPRVAGT